VLFEDEVLTVHEIAEALKVNQQTVRNWIDAGDLAAIRVGKRRVRVRRRDLEAFLDKSNRTPAGEPTPPSSFTEEEAEAWEAFGRAMARTTQKLKRKRSQEGLIETLEGLSAATRDLADVLRSESGETAEAARGSTG
jgi:excisionase family DNA binding protein